MASSSAKDESATSLHVAHNLESYQLLELPHELVTLIDSGSSEPYVSESHGFLDKLISSCPASLYLKSLPSDLLSTLGEEAQQAAVVCTPTQTFSVRQAQSSNSLYILEPNASHSSSPPSLVATARCKAALELTPLSHRGTFDLSLYFPRYHFLGSDAETATISGGLAASSKTQWLSNLPLSQTEFESAWIYSCCFERQGIAVCPDSSALLKFWDAFVLAAQVAGVRFERVFNVADVQRLLDEDGYEPALLDAVLCRLCLEVPVKHQARIDRDKCAAWLLHQTLKAAGSQGLLERELMDRWEALLPGLWKGDANVEKLDQVRLIPKPTWTASWLMRDSVQGLHENFGPPRIR